MTDQNLRCPRCHSANILSSPFGQRQCEDCRFSFGIELSPSYALDRHGNKTWLNPQAEARHKAALVKAAGMQPFIMGIDPQHMRGVLEEARRQALCESKETPWYKPHVKVRLKAFAAAFTSVAKMFTGEPV